MRNIFIISRVRGREESYTEKLIAYVRSLEESGNTVHLPCRDTNQEASSLGICQQNEGAIDKADEVHIFYSSSSQGTHFDIGVAFAKRKKIVVVESEPPTVGKSFQNLLIEYKQWHEQQEAGGVAE